MAQMNISAKQKQTHRHRELNCGCQGVAGGGEEDWEFGISVRKLLYVRWINKVIHIAQGTIFNTL